MQSSEKKVRDTRKKVRDTFFKPVEGTDDVWVCRYGTKRKVKDAGYANFVTHVQSQHPAEHSALLATLSIATSSQSKAVDSLFYSKNAVQVHGWLQFVVHCLQPFQVVEDPKFTEHIRYESLTQKSFKKYLEKLTKIVEQKIRNILPDIFAIVFDWWTTSDSHYCYVRYVCR